MSEANMTPSAPAATNSEGQAGAPADNAASTLLGDNAAPEQGNEPSTATDPNAKSEGDDPSTTGEDGKTDSKHEDKAKPEGAPESYEDFQLPEGVEFAPEMSDGIKSVAKELNLTQAQAQKLADLAADRTKAFGSEQAQAIEQARNTWGESAKTDKEFGGEKLNENLSVAKKALDTFGTPELRTLLNESGLGNHPEIIRAFYRAGKAISEDKLVPAGSGVSKGSGDHAKSLYPNQ